MGSDSISKMKPSWKWPVGKAELKQKGISVT